MRVLAIDFGTSNTVAMVRTPDSRMRPLLFDGSPLLPSAVYLNTDGRMLVGRDAERHARMDPSRFEPNPKRRIDDGQVYLGDTELPVPQMISTVLGQVVTEARRQLGGQPEEVRMTHPARWGERRRSLLAEAARQAGLGNPRLIPEPVGAASYFTAVLGTQIPVGRSIAIYDLGGGTFDATVVRRTRTGFEVLAEEGLADVGGLDFDHAIVEHLGRAYRETHADTWRRLASPSDANDRRHRRLLYEDVRGAKEMLSRTSSTDIHLPALEVDAHLTREEVEALVRPYLERTVDCLRRTVESARLAPAELVGIFLVGGSSRIPLAAHLIHTELMVAPTTLEQPETVVVEGALCIGVNRGTGAAPPVSGQPMSGQPMSGQPMSGQPMSGQPMSGQPMSGQPMSGQQRRVGPAPSAPPQRQAQPPVAPPTPATPVPPPMSPAAQQMRPAPMPPPARTGTAPPPPGAPHAGAPHPGSAHPGSAYGGPVAPPASVPPTPSSGAPVSGSPPAGSAPGPASGAPVAGRPGPQPPRLLRPPPVHQAPPVMPAQPVHQQLPQQMPPQMRPSRPRPQRKWYAEPAIIWTGVLLVLVLVAFLVLVNTTFSSG